MHIPDLYSAFTMLSKSASIRYSTYSFAASTPATATYRMQICPRYSSASSPSAITGSKPLARIYAAEPTRTSFPVHRGVHTVFRHLDDLGILGDAQIPCRGGKDHIERSAELCKHAGQPVQHRVDPLLPVQAHTARPHVPLREHLLIVKGDHRRVRIFLERRVAYDRRVCAVALGRRLVKRQCVHREAAAGQKEGKADPATPDIAVAKILEKLLPPAR